MRQAASEEGIHSPRQIKRAIVHVAITHCLYILYQVGKTREGVEGGKNFTLVKQRVDKVRIVVQRVRQTRIYDLQQHLENFLKGLNICCLQEGEKERQRERQRERQETERERDRETRQR